MKSRSTLDSPRDQPVARANDVTAASAATGVELPGGATPDPYARETTAERDSRMKWWREARFGMFIHWGVYSVPAGKYRGRDVGGIGEWIMNNAKIPMAEYRTYARQFNPTKYDPDAWVRLARDAGMKYIVITSKHHDGFALFDSKVTDWDVIDATPYGKDLLAPLAAACEKYGLKLGFYYSQAQDWNHPGGAAIGGHWDRAQDGDMDAYIRNIAAPQVRELLTRYGKIAILWWDTPIDMNRERAEQLIGLLRLQPGIIHNNRLGGGFQGDTETPEQSVPATGLGNRDWETCMTMNDTWGYKSDDHNFKSSETLVRNLVDIASKGGNYLLNVGPTAEGLIPEPSVVRLEEIGAWMKVNGEAIYATTASPFRNLPWGRATKRHAGTNTLLYLHVFDWPAGGELLVPRLRSKPSEAYLLAARNNKLSFRTSAAGLVISLPHLAPSPFSSVVVLTIVGEPDVEPITFALSHDGGTTLTAVDATLHGRELRYESGDHRNNVGYWSDPSEWVSWPIRIDRPGTFAVTAEIASLGTGRFGVVLGASKLSAAAPNTGDWGHFVTVELGTLHVAETGILPLEVRPIGEAWSPINLRSVTLKRTRR